MKTFYYSLERFDLLYILTQRKKRMMFLCFVCRKPIWFIFLKLFAKSSPRNFIINLFESKFENNYNSCKGLCEFLNSKDIYFYEMFNSACTISLIENIEKLELSGDKNMFYLYIKFKNDIKCFSNERNYLLKFIIYESISLQKPNDEIKSNKHQNLVIFNKKKPLFLLYRIALSILLDFIRMIKKIEKLLINSKIELILAPFLLNEKEFRNLNFFIFRQTRSSLRICDFYILKASSFFTINIGKQPIKEYFDYTTQLNILFILTVTKYRFYEENSHRFPTNYILNERLLNIEVYTNTYTIVRRSIKNKEYYIHESHKSYEFLNYIKKTALNYTEKQNSNEFIFLFFGSNRIHLKIDLHEKHLTKDKYYYTVKITFIESILFEEYFFEFDEINSKIGEIKRIKNNLVGVYQPEKIPNLQFLIDKITFYTIWHLYQCIEERYI